MNFSTLVALIRRNVGAATPQSGGTDVLDDDTIIEYLNDAFTMMNDNINGFPAYVEFTKTAGGVITVTEPESTENPPTIALQNPPLESYPLYTISDARSYTRLDNKTSGLEKTPDRKFIRKSIENRGWQTYYNRTATYHDVYDILGKRGFPMFPKTITTTNTIGIVYRRNFIRYAVSDLTQSTGTGLSDLTLSGIYTKADRFDDIDYAIKIASSVADPDTYEVSVDGGVTYGTPVDCSTTATAIDSNGLKIAFATINGHTNNDVWTFTATAPSLDELTEEEQRTFPRYWGRYCCIEDVDDDRTTMWRNMAVGPDYFTRNRVGGALQKFAENRQNIDVAMDLDLSNPLEQSIGSGYR